MKASQKVVGFFHRSAWTLRAFTTAVALLLAGLALAAEQDSPRKPIGTVFIEGINTNQPSEVFSVGFNVIHQHQSGIAHFGGFELIKPIDATSPKIFLAAIGEHLKRATVDLMVTGPTGSAPAGHAIYVLTDVTIIGDGLVTEVSSPVAVEKVTLMASQYEVTIDNVKTCYNVAQNKKC